MMTGIDPDGVKSELRRTQARLEQAILDRDQLRRQLSDIQKMFHLAARERDEARDVAREYLCGLWDEFPDSMQWKKDAIAKEIADHPWLTNAHIRQGEEK